MYCLKLLFRACLAAVSLIAPAALHAQQLRQWAHGTPTAEEQATLEVINFLRRDPDGAVDYLARLADRDEITKAAVGGARANLYADGFVGFDFAHSSQAPVGYVYGAEAIKGMLRARIAEMVRARVLNDQSVAPLGGYAPPLPPLAFHPLLSEQARIQGAAAVDGSEFAVFRATFFSEDNASGLPGKIATPPMWIRADAMPFRAPSINGPGAAGGMATIRAGVPPVPPSLANRSRGQQLVLQSLYDQRVDLSHALLTDNFQPHEFLREAFGWDADANGVRSYGRSTIVGLHVSNPRTEAPGLGTRLLNVFRVDNRDVDDLPWADDTVFLTGVAYEDRDLSGGYSAGEGIEGLRVEGADGWYAITSGSGGYAVPVRRGAGEMTISFRGRHPGDGSEFSSSQLVIVGDTNVKVDAVLPRKLITPPQQQMAGSIGTTAITNLATRGFTTTGPEALTSGFSITGSTEKTLLIRAVSNSLLDFGVTGVMAKPRVTLFNSSGAEVRIGRTQDTYVRASALSPTVVVRPELVAAFRQVGAFDLSVLRPPYSGQPRVGLYEPGGALNNGDAYDVAMIVQLAPGTYSVSATPDSDSHNTNSAYYDSSGQPLDERTIFDNPSRYPAHQRLVWGSLGVVLLEVYDLTPSSQSRIRNLSTRGKIIAGSGPLIVGFGVSGTGEKRLLVRGISPALRSFGVQDTLDEPTLEVYSGSQRLDRNNGWSTSVFADQIATLTSLAGGFPLSRDARDSATLVRIGPGPHTAVIAPGAGVRSGVVLAEIYVTDP